jgi:exonuclease SbcC
MITRIRLKNWKSHLDSEFKFSKGVNAFIGQMGAGKTSVMDAISFALYGTFPTHKSRKVPLDELIMKKPQKKRTSMVELFFRAGVKEYSVKRVLELEKGTTSAEIREDGNLLEVNPQGVTGMVEGILQMDYDLFSRAVYSEQNALDYFLTIPSGHRKDLIDRMLRLERFEKAREASVALANRTEQQGEEKARMVSDMEREGIEEKIGKLEGDLRGLKGESRELKARYRLAASERKALEERLSVFEEKENLLNEIKSRLSGIDAGLKEVREGITEGRKRLRGRDARAMKERIRQAERKIRDSESGLEKKRREAESGRERIAGLNTEIMLVTKDISKLEGLGARCPVCESRVTEAKKQELVGEKREREQGLRGEVNSLVLSVKMINQERDSLERRLRERELQRERFSGLLEEAERIGDLRKRQGEYSKEKEGLRREKARLEKGFDRAGLKALRKSMEEKGAEEASLKERVSGLGERLEEGSERLREIRERRELLERYRKELVEGEKIRGDLKRFTRALLLTQEQLRSEFLKTVNNIMDRVWQELYPYGDFEGIRLAIEGDYTLQLREPGGWVSVEGRVSGGERSMACLALRIAFSLAFIPNLRWLILDEPTHNLDSGAIEHFARILRERMPEFVEQVFLITHEERISEGVTGNLYKLERDKEQNGPTQVAGN